MSLMFSRSRSVCAIRSRLLLLEEIVEFKSVGKLWMSELSEKTLDGILELTLVAQPFNYRLRDIISIRVFFKAAWASSAAFFASAAEAAASSAAI